MSYFSKLLSQYKDVLKTRKEIYMKNDAGQIITEVKPENEHPYRIKIDGSCGIGITPSSAIMAALSVSKKIPSGTRDRKEAVHYILTNYPPKKGWVRIQRMLTYDSFTVFMD